MSDRDPRDRATSDHPASVRKARVSAASDRSTSDRSTSERVTLAGAPDRFHSARVGSDDGPSQGAAPGAFAAASDVPVGGAVPDDAARAALLWIALSEVPGLGRSLAWRLIDRHGSAEAIYRRARAGQLAGCPASVISALTRRPDLAALRARLDGCARRGIRVYPGASAALPERLRSIPDPPWLLWVRGELRDGPSLAIVGARRATERGRKLARQLARAAAAARVCVVSGLAYGVDVAAHQGALDAGAPGIVVLASGLARPSPTGNLAIADRVWAAGGAWVSEYTPDCDARPHQFPERNRLISGLAHATLVVEAQERSGSLWTARHALEQGRDVLVVPGPVDADICRGSNALLRDGATPILDASDLLAVFGLDAPAPSVARAPGEGGPADEALAARVLIALRRGPTEADALVRALAVSHAAVSHALIELEVAGRIERAGGRIALA
jgi:DNA processing protein